MWRVNVSQPSSKHADISGAGKVVRRAGHYWMRLVRFNAFSTINRGLIGALRRWQAVRFERKLAGALLIMLVLTVSWAMFANWTAKRSHFLFERSRLAHDVLRGFLKLSSLNYEFFETLNSSLTVGSGRKPDRSREVMLISEMRTSLSTLRKRILAEIAFVGSVSDENEEEEFHRLAALEQLVALLLKEYHEVAALRDDGMASAATARLRTMIESPMTTQIRSLIGQGVEDELHETNKVDALAHDLLNEVRHLAIVSLAFTTAFGALSIIVLVGAVRRPLKSIEAGLSAYDSDDWSYRIPVLGRDEFSDIARSLNKMAAEREARNVSEKLTQRGLEEAVADRTRQLVDANRSLEQADASRRRFLADISHELRTPLTVVRGESEIALRGSDKSSAEYKEALRRIQEQADHTAKIVDDLLFLARQESGEMRLHLQEVCVRTLIAQCCKEFEGFASQSHVHIEITADPDTIAGAIDRNRIRQLIFICLDNALRYSLPNGRIEVHASRQPVGIAISIRDFGIGIAGHDLPFIFERFYRSAQARAHHPDGMGLGLPMAKAIAEAHGGTIAIESETKSGTVVKILLPLMARVSI